MILLHLKNGQSFLILSATENFHYSIKVNAKDILIFKKNFRKMEREKEKKKVKILNMGLGSPTSDKWKWWAGESERAINKISRLCRASPSSLTTTVSEICEFFVIWQYTAMFFFTVLQVECKRVRRRRESKPTFSKKKKKKKRIKTLITW